MPIRSRTQRSLLLTFIGSIAACGVVGIYCLLLDRMDNFTERILSTTGSVGGASILCLAAAIPWERRRWQPLGPLGIAAVCVALVLMLVAIWADLSEWKHKTFFKLLGVSCAMAVALPHIGLLSLARLHRQFEWIRVATVAVIGVLALQICASIVAEVRSDEWYRLMGILGILAACGAIAVPILHRVSAIRLHDEIVTSAITLSLTCPRCSKTQELSAGLAACSGCGLRLRIEILEETCEKCGYVLYGTSSAVCPECGAPVLRHPAAS